MDPIHMAGQLRFRLAFMRHGRHVIAELPGVVRENDRESTIAGNESNPFTMSDMR
jgi:hypothetical protein